MQRISKVLSITDLSFSYGGNHLALQQVSYEVSAGEVIGLVGPNGSGKTTLLKLVFDLLELRTGHIAICGSNHLDIAAKSAGIYLPSDDYLPEFLTGKEYIHLVFQLYDQQIVTDECIAQQFELFGMAGRQKHLIEDYSHGMRKKLQLTTAFLLKPPLIVIDETFNGIDLDAIRISKQCIHRLRAAGSAFIVCTHDFTLLEDVADRVLVLNGGRIQHEVAVDSVLESKVKLGTVIDDLVFHGSDNSRHGSERKQFA